MQSKVNAQTTAVQAFKKMKIVVFVLGQILKVNGNVFIDNIV